MIHKIKWNDEVLGKLELDFTKNNIPCKTIIIAGENGSGKTRVLKTISEFMNFAFSKYFDYIIYSVNNKTFKLTFNGNDNPPILKRFELNNPNSKEEFMSFNKISVEKDDNDLRKYGFIYTSSQTKFNTGNIQTTTIEKLDNEKRVDDTSYDYKNIKQLLVDISSQDNYDWATNCRKEKNNLRPEMLTKFENNSRMSRFRNAFNSFFDNDLSYVGGGTVTKKGLSVLFRKNGVEIDLDDLSSGEKQIVYRGANCLRNNTILNDGIVLIDEPELSLHPRWQEKILDYYCNIFKNNGIQTVQIIIATHSQYVVSKALEKPDCKVIVFSSKGNIVESNEIEDSLFPNSVSVGVNFSAFNIYSVEYFLSLYCKTQTYALRSGKNDSIIGCDTFIKNHKEFEKNIHEKKSKYTDKRGKTIEYETLPTFVRNIVCHPDSKNKFSFDDLKKSTDLLIKICNSEMIKEKEETSNNS